MNGTTSTSTTTIPNGATGAIPSTTSTVTAPAAGTLWKMTAIGMALVLGTALTTGLATAYFMGPADRPAAEAAPVVRRASASAPRFAPERPAPARVQYVSSRPARTQYASAGMGSCDTNAKIGTIAKDGLIGGLLGAAVGAGSGAIINGGKAAGKGAAIGGITGAVAGGLYGAHQNGKNCS